MVIFGSKTEITTFDFYNNLTLEMLTKNFSDYIDNGKLIKKSFDLSDVLLIPNGHRLTRSKDYNTKLTINIGLYIFMEFCLSDTYIKHYPIITDSINASVYNTILNNYTELKISSKVTTKEYADFLDRIHWLGNVMVSFSGEGFDSESLLISKDLAKYRDELFEENKHNLNDVKVGIEIEEKLIERLQQEKKHSSLGRIIGSGAKGNYSNNYKNLVLTRGIVNGKFIKNNLTDGNDIEAYMNLGFNALEGTVGRAIKTASGGYQTKLLARGFSSSSIVEEECGTNIMLKTTITYKKFKYRLVSLQDNVFSTEELTLDNKDKYEGKLGFVRSPLFCKSKDGLCEKCFGNLWKYNGVKNNLSSLLTTVSSQIMLKSMKSFHDLRKSFTELDFRRDDYFN